MNNTSEPVWLKVMEHGAAGEARTKAFLLDRFWVLERSVDVEGADFLIQLRSLSTRFTDSAPPRIGVVQAKYFQNRATTHYIPCHYVVDDKDAPLKGFFAVLHVGQEDDTEMFLLSAKEIAVTLERAKEGPPRFIVGKKAMNPKFRITSRRLALDKIQHELALRTSLESFRFLDSVNIPYRKVVESDIDYIYTLPIPNSQANIPKTFHEYRNGLRSLLYEIEEAVVAIDNILKTTDPNVALKELEKLVEHRGGTSHRNGLSFSGYKCDLDWHDLDEALAEHDKAIAALTNKGQQEAFVTLSDEIKREMDRQIQAFESVAEDGQKLFVSLEFDRKSLIFGRLKLRLLDSEQASPEAEFFETQPIWSIGARKIIVADLAEQLWHRLMSKLLRSFCPELYEEEDD